MKNKVSKTGINRTSRDGYYALLETQHDIDVLIRDFDRSGMPGGRTLSAVCSRALEELKLATENNTVEIFSLNDQIELYTNPLLHVEETVYANIRKYRFSTIRRAIDMYRFPLLRTKNKLPLPRWSAEAAFIVNFSSKKPISFSRRDVLSTIRNDIGAHFVTDITKRYHLLSQEHQQFRLSRIGIAGPPELDNYLDRPVGFYNSPLPYIIRSLAAEIQATIYDVIRKSKHSEDPVDLAEEDFGEIIFQGFIESSGNAYPYPDSVISLFEKHHKDRGVLLRE